MNSFVDEHIKWVFSLSAFIFIMATIAVPIVMTSLFSLSDWNPLTGNRMLFNWGKNCPDVLASREFWQSLRITLYYTATATVAEVLLGLAVTPVPNKDFRGKNGVKTVVLLSYMMAPVVVGLIWMLFYESPSGLFNYILTTVGLPRPALISAKQTAIPAITAVKIQQMTPMVVIVYPAELSSLLVGPMEAARANRTIPIQTFFQVTSSLLIQTLFPIDLLWFIGVFKSFDLIYAMTKEGPADVSRTLNLFAYEATFSYYRFGLSSTMFVISSVIVLLPSILVTKIQGKLVAYYGG